MNNKHLFYSGKIKSTNPNKYGIADSTQLSGHRQVKTLEDLFEIPEMILSESGDNTDNDAIGQLWYVQSEECFYQLIDWENKGNTAGWEEISSGTKIVTSDSELDDSAPNGSLAVVASADASTLYIKENEVWKKFNVEIENSLESNDTDKALSAAQGKELNEKITTLGSTLQGEISSLETTITNRLDTVNSTKNDLVTDEGITISNTKDFYKYIATDGNDIAIMVGEMTRSKVKEVLLVIDNYSSNTINVALPPDDDTTIFINNMEDMYVNAESTSEFSFLIDTTDASNNITIIRVAGLIKE